MESAARPAPAWPESGHEPVLLSEVLQALQPMPGKIFIDCTTGRGGHSLAHGGEIGAGGHAALPRCRPAQSGVRPPAACRRSLPRPLLPRQLRRTGRRARRRRHHRASTASSPTWASAPISSSNPPTACPSRRRCRWTCGSTRASRASAADLVNHLREEDLANVLYELAQERYSRRIARKIGEARRLSPITTTERLADLVRSAIPRRGGAPEKIDPATRTFLALRMAVNQELENLEALLQAGAEVSEPGGRFAVISFQSMEDRLVKQAFRLRSRPDVCEILTNKPLSPSPEEIAANPRSRSAKLRAVVRNDDKVEGDAMTRETKIGLLVGLAFIIIVGILLGDSVRHAADLPPAPLPGVGPNVRSAVSTPGGNTAPPPISVQASSGSGPQQTVPMQQRGRRPAGKHWDRDRPRRRGSGAGHLQPQTLVGPRTGDLTGGGVTRFEPQNPPESTELTGGIASDDPRIRAESARGLRSCQSATHAHPVGGIGRCRKSPAIPGRPRRQSLEDRHLCIWLQQQGASRCDCQCQSNAQGGSQ